MIKQLLQLKKVVVYKPKEFAHLLWIIPLGFVFAAIASLIITLIGIGLYEFLKWIAYNGGPGNAWFIIWIGIGTTSGLAAIIQQWKEGRDVTYVEVKTTGGKK